MNRQSWTLIQATAVAMCVLVAYPLTADAQEIDVTPIAINVTVPLGETATRTLTIRNLGSENLTWELHWNPGNVIRQFNIPTQVGYSSYGVAFDGKVLWVSNGSSKLYKLDPVTGALKGTLNVVHPFFSPTLSELDWDGVYLWAVENNNERIFAINPATGECVKSMLAPPLVPSGYRMRPQGIVMNEGYLWWFSGGDRWVYKADPADASVVAKVECRFNGLPAPIFALEYINGGIYGVPLNNAPGYYSNNEIFKFNPANGTVIHSFQGPRLEGIYMGFAEDETGPTRRMWMISPNNAFLVDLGEVRWLKEDRSSGTVAGGGSQTVMLTLDTLVAGLGVHTVTIYIRSNDPDEPEVLVPLTFTVEVNPDNHPPVAANQSVTTAEDTAQAITLAATDADGHALTYGIVSQPAHGTLSGSAPNMTYTPMANYNGNDSFTFRASDYEYASNLATVTVTVSAVNDPPVAMGDSYRTDPDSTLTVSAPGALANDTDVDGHTLHAVLVTGVSHGTLNLNGDGSFRYVPANGYSGTDSFTYQANDGAADSAPATVTIGVSGAKGDIVITCDSAYELYLNGVKLGTGNQWKVAQSYLAVALRTGQNAIAVRGTDAGGVAGFLADLVIDGRRTGSGTNWKVALTEAPGWIDVGYDDSGWAPPSDYGAFGVSPWGTTVSGMPADTPGRWIWSSNYGADQLVCFRYSFLVGAANEAPTIVSPAWADPNSVTLPAGTTTHVVASDPDGDPLTYAWTKVSGAGTATFATAAAADSGVTFSAAGVYILRVTVADGKGGSVTSDVSVTVTDGSGADPRADCNADGVVNALDLQIVIANFGKVVP